MTNPLELGKSGGMLHVLEGPLQGQAFPLQAPEMLLGREGGALDLSRYVQLSRHHTRLVLVNGAWSAQDLGSTNGTHVNGERIATRLLQDGDVLQLGDFKARISFPGPARTTPIPGRTQVAPQVSPPTQAIPQSAPPYPPHQSPPHQSSPSANPSQPPWPPQSTPPHAPSYAPPGPPQYQPPIPPPHQYPPAPHYSPPGAPSGSPLQAGTSPMSIAGLICGTIALCLMLVGMVPCFGWINWFTVPLAALGAILSGVGLAADQNSSTRNNAIIGLTLSLVAFGVGGLRLLLGGGIC